MHKSNSLAFGTAFVASTFFLMTVSAQMDDDFHSPSTDLPPTGPVGQVDDGRQDTTDLEDQLPEWHDLASYTGPLGQVDEYLPHDACEECFTLPHYDKYSIYEYVKADVEDTEERVWYVGTQEFVGPTDEEKWSPDLPLLALVCRIGNS